MKSVVIQIQIEGSTGTPYVASFTRDGNSLKTSCTCQAGERQIHCKHRLSLIEGDTTQVRGNAPPNLAQQIAAMVKGTDVEEAVLALAAAGAEAKTATEKLKRAKKILDRVMH